MGIRKPVPPPGGPHKSKKDYDRKKFKKEEKEYMFVSLDDILEESRQAFEFLKSLIDIDSEISPEHDEDLHARFKARAANERTQSHRSEQD